MHDHNREQTKFSCCSRNVHMVRNNDNYYTRRGEITMTISNSELCSRSEFTEFLQSWFSEPIPSSPLLSLSRKIFNNIHSIYERSQLYTEQLSNEQLSIEFLITWHGFRVDDRPRVFSFCSTENVGSLIFLLHPVDNEHHNKNSTQKANHNATNHTYKKFEC